MKRFIPWLCLALALAGAPTAASASQICVDQLVGMTPSNNNAPATPIFQKQCAWKAGAIAFDTASRDYWSNWNHDNADTARADVSGRCGPGCVSYAFFEDYAYIAISEDDRHWGVSTVSGERAIQECLAAGGRDCEWVMTASSTGDTRYYVFGAVAYDLATGAKGESWNYRRRRDAEAAALKSCGAPGCWAFPFQGGYGAIAKSSDGQLFGAWSDRKGLLASAEREAKKACKKATGQKDCEVVADGRAAHSK